MRRCRVRSPRWTRKESNGPGTAPTAFCTRWMCSLQSESARDDRAADRVRVAAEVLRRRVDGEVGAVLERALVDRRRERVVDGDQRAPAPGDDARDVDDVQQRVRRRLDPDQPRLVAQRGGDGVEVGLVDEVVGQAPAAEHLVDEAVGAAVEVVRQHDVVAGRAHRRDHARGSPPSRRRTRRRSRPRARRAPPRARCASGSPRASSRSPRRTRRRPPARRSRSGGSRGMTEP